jgi:hypothetical protein
MGEWGIEGVREDWRRKWERGNWREIGGRFRASGLVVGILGSGARESNFLELGSRRGFVPSWLGGNNFRKVVLGSFRKAFRKALSTSIFSRTTFFFKR